MVSTDGNTDVLARPLANGDRAVAVLNRTGSARSVSTTLASVGLPDCTVSAKDLWTGASSTTSSALTATVPAHGTAIWRLTPHGCAAPVPTGQLTGNGAKCADDSGSSTTDGNPVILYGCTGNPNQRWTLNTDGSITTLGKCLTAAGSSAGSWVTLSGCGASGQQWTAQSDGTLVAASSGLCLDVHGGGTADSTRLDVWTCGDHQANQAWSLPV